MGIRGQALRRRLQGNRRIAAIVGGVVALIAVGSLGAAVWVTSPVPSHLSERVAERLAGSSGRPVTLGEVAPILREAVVATEDERFYQHHGIDLLGLMRALPYDLVHLSYAQGASTITEQVGKLLYLQGNDHNPWRKLQDAAVALKLEGRYSKDEILAAYLNSAYFGDGAYGIRAASERYFGLAPSRIGTAQASLLAGLIQAPSIYDPLRHPGLARIRQIEVLRSLVANGYLTQGEAEAALHTNPHLRGDIVLPIVNRVRLAPGPAFVWWELALGAVITLVGSAALIASRLPRFRLVHGLIATRAALLAVAVLGAVTIIKSFRTA